MPSTLVHPWVLLSPHNPRGKGVATTSLSPDGAHTAGGRKPGSYSDQSPDYTRGHPLTARPAWTKG